MWTLYSHTSPSGKTYVGVTSVEPKQRWGANGVRYKTNKYFYRAIQKYGWDNFTHRILATGLTKEEASFLEMVCVDFWHLDDPKYGYNINKGGIFGNRMTNETRKKLSELNTGKKLSEDTKRKISQSVSKENHPMYGKHHSDEAKAKMSLAKSGANHPNYGKHLSQNVREKISKSNIGKKRSDEVKQKFYGGNNHEARRVVGINKHNQSDVMIFDCIMDAERQLNISNVNIGLCCRGKRKSAGGYIWQYAEDYINQQQQRKQKQKENKTI